MKATKTLSSTLAALLVAGGIGIAYAQTTTTDGVGSGSGADTPSGRVENSTNASTTNETLSPATPGSTSMDNSTMSTDSTLNTDPLPPQSDRG